MISYLYANKKNIIIFCAAFAALLCLSRLPYSDMFKLGYSGRLSVSITPHKLDELISKIKTGEICETLFLGDTLFVDTITSKIGKTEFTGIIQNNEFGDFTTFFEKMSQARAHCDVIFIQSSPYHWSNYDQTKINSGKPKKYPYNSLVSEKYNFMKSINFLTNFFGDLISLKVTTSRQSELYRPKSIPMVEVGRVTSITTRFIASLPKTSRIIFVNDERTLESYEGAVNYKWYLDVMQQGCIFDYEIIEIGKLEPIKKQGCHL